MKDEAEELRSPDLKLTEYLSNRLEHWQHPRLPHPTPVSDLTNALIAEWIQKPTAMLHDLEESLSWRVAIIIKA